MSNVVQFLETLGSSPLFAESFHGYEEAVDMLEIDAGKRLALLDRDHVALNRLLDGRIQMVCAVCTPDDGSEHEAIPDERDKDGDRIPGDEESPAGD